jgi:multidrug efflux pump
MEKMRQNPLFKEVASDQQNGGLQTYMTIDRDKAARLSITPQQIDNLLYDSYGQRQILTLFTNINQYRVVLEVLPELQKSPKDLMNLYLKNSLGTPIPLSNFTSTVQKTGPLVINRQGQFPVSTISFNLNPQASLGEAVKAINEAKSEVNIPESVQTSFEGAAKIFQGSLDNEGWLILAAIIVVYIVLGVLYESYIHPMTILSTLPSAGIGALIALMICGKELTVIALIGILLLIGIVKKNAIMMVDFALEQEREEGKKS